MTEACRVLIIDDSADDRFLYCRALRDNAVGRYVIREEENGEAGLAAIEQEQPDCVLLDYSLPGRNGIEVLKRIRSRFPFVAVVMLTGQGNETVAVAAMQEGAQHYITKSTITSETLQRTIRAAVEHCGLQRRVHEQRQSLELFTRALAHDLKEPVRTIRSFLGLIERQDLPPEKVQQYFGYVHRAAERMGALIDTVYLYLRLENMTVPEAAACDCTQALEDAKLNLAALIAEREASITAGVLPVVRAHAAQMVQLLQNLIGNAIRHAHEQPKITISAQLRDKQWEFRVADNGPGIAADDRERIFEPFKRLQPRDGQNSDGLGLGLAICRKIVEGMGGKIWCEPGQPQGSVFCFTIPAAAAVTEAVPLPAQSQEGGHNGLAHILVVDDSEADLELMRFALLDEQKLQCHFSVARDGKTALARVMEGRMGKARVDLMILDINMPGMDGFDVLNALRGAGLMQSLPVVLCTTSGYDKDVEQGTALGAVGHIVKPLQFSALRGILDHCPTLRFKPEQRQIVAVSAG